MSYTLNMSDAYTKLTFFLGSLLDSSEQCFYSHLCMNQLSLFDSFKALMMVFVEHFWQSLRITIMLYRWPNSKLARYLQDQDTISLPLQFWNKDMCSFTYIQSNLETTVNVTTYRFILTILTMMWGWTLEGLHSWTWHRPAKLASRNVRTIEPVCWVDFLSSRMDLFWFTAWALWNCCLCLYETSRSAYWKYNGLKHPKYQ